MDWDYDGETILIESTLTSRWFIEVGSFKGGENMINIRALVGTLL